MRPAATASRAVTGLAPTSTMRASPVAASTCDSFGPEAGAGLPAFAGLDLDWRVIDTPCEEEGQAFE